MKSYRVATVFFFFFFSSQFGKQFGFTEFLFVTLGSKKKTQLFQKKNVKNEE